MKKKLALFAFLLAAFSLEGCQLEKPAEFGEICENVSFIWPDESMGRIRIGDNETYDYYLKNHVCPLDHPFCLKQRGADVHRGGLDVNGEYEGDVYIPDEWYCSDRRESCPLDSHLVTDDTGTYCERNSSLHCGKERMNCLYDGVEYGKCGEFGKCQANACLTETVLAADMCKSKVECCGPYCNDCTKNRPPSLCLEGDIEASDDCQENSCSEFGRIECSGVCVNPDTSLMYCGGKMEGNGTCSGEKCFEQLGWRDGDCIKGVCQVSECLLGYHLDGKDGSQRCVADSIESCGAGKVDCKKQSEHAKNITCQLGLCMITSCEDGYTLHDNACIEHENIPCGGDVCGPKSHCNETTLKCECDAGYSNCNGQCFDLKNSRYHCGQCENSICTTDKVHYSAELECIAGICAAAACEDGYNVEDSRCLLSTCNGSETDCIHSDGIGQVKTCKDNVWGSAVSCGDVSCNNDIENCGECLNGKKRCKGRQEETCINGQWQNVVNCDASQICMDGDGCVSCGPGEHVYEAENRCEKDDLNNCGAHGKACAPSEICSTGVCSSCTANQHIYGGACENNDLNNCGVHGVACNSSVRPNGTAFSCNSGTCVATACESGYHTYNNGCEKNDIYNCGSHGYGCPGRSNAVANSCVGGECGYKCNSGYADCNNNMNDGCEVNLSSMHWNTCSGSCVSGYANCDGNASNGCEMNLSPLHWSSCSGSCASGYANCDGNASNGCEVNLAAWGMTSCTACKKGFADCREKTQRAAGGMPYCIDISPNPNGDLYVADFGEESYDFCWVHCVNTDQSLDKDYIPKMCERGQWCYRTPKPSVGKPSIVCAPSNL